MSKIVRKSFGFTLAEVLITLGIIGVIAAITIPTLVNNINNKQFEAAFMENYSILMQATAQILTDHNGDIANAYAGTGDLLSGLSEKVKVLKTCTGGTALGNCWAPKTKNLTRSSSDVEADASPWYTPDADTIVFANGAALQIGSAYYRADCADTSWYSSPKSSGFCAMLWLDVNGLKEPNTLGRDIFHLYMVNQVGVIPDGMEGTDDYDKALCDLSSTNALDGVTCSAKILLEHGMNY